MAVSSLHILSQGPVLQALGRTSLAALWQQLGRARDGALDVPGPVLRATLPPRPAGLIRDYVRNVGGDPHAYRRTVPAHLFPQWSFPLASRTIEGAPYPMLRVVNGGCRIEQRAPLPADEPLELSAQLVEVDDDGFRAVLRQELITGTASVPAAIKATLTALVPLKKRPGGKKKEKARVPDEAREIAFWKLPADAGLDFAKLTGDFNPIHWLPPYARAFGFRKPILHGFGTLARACEGLRRNLLAQRYALASIDVRFTRPLELPARVGLYVAGDTVHVGDAPGGPAYMTGTFSREERDV